MEAIQVASYESDFSDDGLEDNSVVKSKWKNIKKNQRFNCCVKDVTFDNAADEA